MESKQDSSQLDSSNIPQDLKPFFDSLLSSQTLEDLKFHHRTLQEKVYIAKQGHQNISNIELYHFTEIFLKQVFNKKLSEFTLPSYDLTKLPELIIIDNEIYPEKFKGEEIFNRGLDFGRMLRNYDNDEISNASTKILENGHKGLPQIVQDLTYRKPQERATFIIKNKKSEELLTGSGINFDNSRGRMYTRPAHLAKGNRELFRIEPYYYQNTFGILNLFDEESYHLWEMIYAESNDNMASENLRYAFLWLEGGVNDDGDWVFEPNENFSGCKIRNQLRGEYLYADKSVEEGRRSVYTVKKEDLGALEAEESDLVWEFVLISKDD